MFISDIHKKKEPVTQICATLINMWLTWNMYLIVPFAAVTNLHAASFTHTPTFVIQHVFSWLAMFMCACSTITIRNIFLSICAFSNSRKMLAWITTQLPYLNHNHAIQCASLTAEFSENFIDAGRCYGRSSCFCFVIAIVIQSDNELVERNMHLECLRN